MCLHGNINFTLLCNFTNSPITLQRVINARDRYDALLKGPIADQYSNPCYVRSLVAAVRIQLGSERV